MARRPCGLVRRPNLARAAAQYRAALSRACCCVLRDRHPAESPPAPISATLENRTAATDLVHSNADQVSCVPSSSMSQGTHGYHRGQCLAACPPRALRSSWRHWDSGQQPSSLAQAKLGRLSIRDRMPRSPELDFAGAGQSAASEIRQDSTGTWWMPWHLEPMKDVNDCDKPR